MVRARDLRARVLGMVRWLVGSIPFRVFIVTQLGLILLMYLGMAVFPMVSRDVWRAAPENLWLDGWARWDSGWYRNIADVGYTNQPNESGQRDTAFFPLYPLLARAFGWLVGDVVVGGVLVSNVALLAALVLLHELVERKTSREVAARSLVLVAVFPFAFYWGAVYTESLFFLCTVGAFALAERKKWLWAATFAACAGATRTIGVLLAPPLLLLCLAQSGWRRPSIRVAACAAVSPFLGLASYMIFLHLQFGDALAFARSQNAAGWSTNAAGLDRLAYGIGLLTSGENILAGDIRVTDTLHLFVVAWAIPAAVASWRVLGAPYALWSFLAIAPALGIWIGFGRYVAPLFPLFVVTAVWLKNQHAFLAYAFISTLLLSLLSLMYSHFFWVA